MTKSNAKKKKNYQKKKLEHKQSQVKKPIENKNYRPYTKEEFELKNTPHDQQQVVMVPQKDKTHIAIILLYSSSIFTSLLVSLLNQSKIMICIQMIFLVLILDAILIGYIKFQEKDIFKKPYAWFMLATGVSAAIFFYMVNFVSPVKMFWIFGILAISYYVSKGTALLSMAGVLFIYVGIRQAFAVNLMLDFVVCSVLCCMVHLVKTWIHLAYIIVLSVSLEITLYLIQNSFRLDSIFKASHLYDLIILLSCVCLFYMMTQLLFREKSVTQELAACKEDMKEEAIEEIKNDKLKEIIQEQYPLMVKLKQESNALYEHSKKIATICRKAAQELHADVDLTVAGAWYHEIGRLSGKDYVNNGITMVKAYDFPESVIHLMRQHNFKVEFPKSTEAVILLMTDNIVSTLQYLKKQDNRNITPEKIIENTFLVRFDQGVLSEANMSVSQLYQLHQFYISIMNEL